MSVDYLSVDELKTIVQASAIAGPAPYLLVLLLVLTGQRAGEIAELEWSDIDLGKGIWHRREKYRGFRGGPLPLSDLTVEILAQVAPDTTPEGRLICPKGKERTFASTAKRMINRKMQSPEGPAFRWSVHAVRRAFASGCLRLGAKSDTLHYLLRYYDPEEWRRIVPLSSDDWVRLCAPVVQAWALHVLENVLGSGGVDYSRLRPGPATRAGQSRRP